MEKSKKLVDGQINSKELNQAIIDLLDELDSQDEEVEVEITEEEKTKRKSIWDRLSS